MLGQELLVRVPNGGPQGTTISRSSRNPPLPLFLTIFNILLPLIHKTIVFYFLHYITTLFLYNFHKNDSYCTRKNKICYFLNFSKNCDTVEGVKNAFLWFLYVLRMHNLLKIIKKPSVFDDFCQNLHSRNIQKSQKTHFFTPSTVSHDNF